ncbi:MAG: N-formylglutamate amidohydrolase, partial [Bacteroidales bacterium]
RVFCDVERYENDAEEPMAAIGMGVLYETTDDGSPLRMVTPQLRESILEEFYRPYHQKFTGVVAAHLEKYGEARIIDAHSFSDTPFFRDLDQSKGRPDICIGTDPFHTPTEWIESAEEFFHSKEISLAIDRPYKGSIVPLQYYKKNNNVKSIMLEVNRKLYMDEQTTERLAKYNRIKMLVAEFIKRIKLC